jgi:hypothetical protein
LLAKVLPGGGIQTRLLRLRVLPAGKVVKDDPVFIDPKVWSGLRRRMTQQKNPDGYEPDYPEKRRYLLWSIILPSQGRAPMEGLKL